MGSAPRTSPDPLDGKSPGGESPQKRSTGDSEKDSASYGAGALDELRQLIVGPERDALRRLRERVANPASRTEDVSEVVAESIHLRREQGGDEALSAALSPTIETALRESVRKDPATLADALFPVMGPAIRRSILETLRSFLASFNQVLDQSLSWQGMKWRLEALRTGRSFTEVALLHSLVFRVEQVFLIHKRTGLPIAHVVAPAVAMQDPGLVSGMLSAIQEFVRDSFHAEQGQGINRLQVGELEVWIEDGPYAILAAVIRGVAPRMLRDRMAESLEEIHAGFSGKLERFDGETTPFAAASPVLSRCLDSQFRQEAPRLGFAYAWAAGGLLLCLLGGFFGWRWWELHRWNQLAATLSEQPGLVLTSFARENGRYVFRGLRDPLAPDPAALVRAAQLDPARAEFHWGAYYALDDPIVQQRATALLAPPLGVTLSVKEGVLRITGGEPALQWTSGLRARALLVPGIRAVEISPQFSPERLAFDQAKSRIESLVIKFPLASATLPLGERAKLGELLPHFKQVLNAPELRGSTIIDVIGHSDATGGEAANQDLSQRRADRVASELAQWGIVATALRTKGVASTQPVRAEDSEANRQFNRSVTLRVATTP